MPPPPDLDTAMLDRLARLMGEAALDELLADATLALLDRRRKLAETLDAARPSGPACPSEAATAVARIGHDLTAMAGQIGLAALSSAARGLDAAARTASVAGTIDATTHARGLAVLAALDRGTMALAAYRNHAGARNACGGEQS